MLKTPVYVAPSAHAPLVASTIERREPGPEDVWIEIDYCGVCHSDLHQVRDEWSGALFPMVPGHEIVGRVKQVGAKVTRFKVGDRAGVGCLVDSCGTCDPCRSQHQQFCQKGAAMTYNGTEMDRKTPTYGGYATQVVVAEKFTLRSPTGWTWRPPRRFCARASPPIRRSSSGTPRRAIAWAWWAWAASATWRSSWRRRWARR